jgi:hypothetical protein
MAMQQPTTQRPREIERHIIRIIRRMDDEQIERLLSVLRCILPREALR